MKYSVIVSKMAYRDLQRIQTFYDKIRPQAGAKIVDQITTAIQRLEYMPLQCPVYQPRDRYRRMIVGKFLVFYSEQEHEVSIRRAFDGRMDVEKRLTR